MYTPDLDALRNLPVTAPSGAANPLWWPLLTATAAAPKPPASRGFTDWLNQNSTAVVAISGALCVLALFGGRRR